MFDQRSRQRSRIDILDGDSAAFDGLVDAEPGPAIDFGTEAGLYAELGMPTAICGPGDIGDAHRPGESIAMDQLERCEAMLAQLVERLRS